MAAAMPAAGQSKNYERRKGMTYCPSRVGKVLSLCRNSYNKGTGGKAQLFWDEVMVN